MLIERRQPPDPLGIQQTATLDGGPLNRFSGSQPLSFKVMNDPQQSLLGFRAKVQEERIVWLEHCLRGLFAGGCIGLSNALQGGNQLTPVIRKEVA